VRAFLDAIGESELASLIRNAEEHTIPPLTGASGFSIAF